MAILQRTKILENISQYLLGNVSERVCLCYLNMLFCKYFSLCVCLQHAHSIIGFNQTMKSKMYLYFDVYTPFDVHLADGQSVSMLITEK